VPTCVTHTGDQLGHRPFRDAPPGNKRREGGHVERTCSGVTTVERNTGRNVKNAPPAPYIVAISVLRIPICMFAVFSLDDMRGPRPQRPHTAAWGRERFDGPEDVGFPVVKYMTCTCTTITGIPSTMPSTLEALISDQCIHAFLCHIPNKIPPIVTQGKSFSCAGSRCSSESCDASLGPWSPCVSAVRPGVADRRPRQTGGHRRMTGGFVPRRDELRLETRRARVKPELQRLR
jgi:hypothetical protein